MNSEEVKMTKLLNWVKKTYSIHTKDTSAVIVQKYFENPKNINEENLPMSCFHIDGDGDAFDDYGTGSGGQQMKETEKRYCKGCQADVTESMYCSCGNFGLLKSETLSAAECSCK